MKQLLFLLFIFAISCTEKTDELEGAWSLKYGNTTGTGSNSAGYLWESLIFHDDSVFISESRFLKGPHVPYKIENDSIEFIMEGNPKYSIKLKGERLTLSGEHSINGCGFNEKKNI